MKAKTSNFTQYSLRLNTKSNFTQNSLRLNTKVDLKTETIFQKSIINHIEIEKKRNDDKSRDKVLHKNFTEKYGIKTIDETDQELGPKIERSKKPRFKKFIQMNTLTERVIEKKIINHKEQLGNNN